MSIQFAKQWKAIIRQIIPQNVYQNMFYSKSKALEPKAAKIESIKNVPALEEGKSTITVFGTNNISPVSGIPEDHIKGRLVRIYCTPKNAMQSGTNNVNQWEMEFETRERWENSLMGWSSTGDPHSNVKLQFSDKDSAINFAEKNGYQWFLEVERKNNPKRKSYGFNFSWNKRTRVTTK